MTPEAAKFIVWRNARLKAPEPKERKSSPPIHKSINSLRNVKLYEFRGETLPVSEISDRLGISQAAVYNRIRNGISLDLSKADAAKRAALYPFRGQMLSVAEIAALLGVTDTIVYHRIANGIPLEKPRRSRDRSNAKRQNDPDKFHERSGFDDELYSIHDNSYSLEEIENVVGHRIDY